MSSDDGAVVAIGDCRVTLDVRPKCLVHVISEAWETALALGADYPYPDCIVAVDPYADPRGFALRVGSDLSKLNHEIRYNIAARADHADVIRVLAKDPSCVVRAALAHWGEVSLYPDVIDQLVHDEDALVRRVVASRHSLSPEQFRHLAGDDDEDVRIALARNPETPDSILRMLAQDRSAQVRELIPGYIWGIPPES